MDIVLNFFALALRQAGDLVIDAANAVVRVNAQVVKQFAVFGEQVFVKHLYRVSKHDGVRNLHHRCFHVQGKHDTGFFRIFQLVLKEIAERFLAHVHAVDDFIFQQRHLLFEHLRLPVFGNQFHAYITGLVQGKTLFAVIEVTVAHVGYVGARSRAPRRHRVRIFTREALDGSRCAAVRVAFAQHGIDRTAQYARVTLRYILFCLGFRFFRVVGNLVALALQFPHRCHQLRQGGADIGQFDDIRAGHQSELAQLA